MIQLKNIFEQQTTPITIFADMDGVLCDFEKQFQNITGVIPRTYEAKYGEDKFWKIIEDAGIDYWANMPWMPDGKYLWNELRLLPYPVEILSAVSKPEFGIVHDQAKKGKTIWCRKNLSQHVPLNLVIREQKQDYSGPGSILIDDMAKNIDEWRSKGGFGILHKNAKRSIDEIKEFISKTTSI